MVDSFLNALAELQEVVLVRCDFGVECNLASIFIVINGLILADLQLSQRLAYGLFEHQLVERLSFFVVFKAWRIAMSKLHLVIDFVNLYLLIFNDF